MSFYVEKKSQKKGVRYRIVKDVTRGGKRIRSYHTLPAGTSKANADKICTQMALESEYGNYVPKKPLSFSEYVEEIYFPKYTNYLSVTTKQHYEQVYYAPKGIKEYMGNFSFSEITVELLQGIVNDYAISKSPKTIRNYLNFVSVVIKQAMNDNYMKRQDNNPCMFVRLPKLHEQEGHAYTMEEVKIMLERADKSKNSNVELAVALCCLAGGLRRSELIGLRWEDIVLGEDTAYICVQRAIVQTKKGIFEKETKTKAGRRIIPLNINGIVYGILLKARKNYMKIQSETVDFKGDNRVFIQHQMPYKPLTPNQLYNEFKKFLKNICPDLPSYRLHDLRHTYFTLCSNIEGFSELSLIGTGGHSTILSTKRYQHPVMQKMRSDLGKLEETFENISLVSNN
jgi:integrase